MRGELLILIYKFAAIAIREKSKADLNQSAINKKEQGRSFFRHYITDQQADVCLEQFFRCLFLYL
jgi:hypothetical protein